MENKHDEVVLAITREAFEQEGTFQGYRSLRGKTWLADILANKEAVKFAPRSTAETDTSLKQLIPYVAVIAGDSILMYERGMSGSEERLHSQLSIGIGGHINEEDDAEDPLFAFINGSIREIQEEIGIKIGADDLMQSLYGLINDESNPVGQVHLGVGFAIRISEEDKEHVIKSCEDCLANAKFIPIIDLEDPATYTRLETWSRYLAMGYIQERSTNGKWHDAAFRERVGLLAICSSNLASACSGYLLEETPRTHMKARENVERGAGEVVCMLEGLNKNGDIAQAEVKRHAQEFFSEITKVMKHQNKEE